MSSSEQDVKWTNWINQIFWSKLLNLTAKEKVGILNSGLPQGNRLKQLEFLKKWGEKKSNKLKIKNWKEQQNLNRFYRGNDDKSLVWEIEKNSEDQLYQSRIRRTKGLRIKIHKVSCSLDIVHGHCPVSLKEQFWPYSVDWKRSQTSPRKLARSSELEHLSKGQSNRLSLSIRLIIASTFEMIHFKIGSSPQILN